MTGLHVRDFQAPDETRRPDKTQVDVVRMGGTTAARFTFEPGWKWSECVKPVAGTESLPGASYRCRALRQVARRVMRTVPRERSDRVRRTSSNLATMHGWSVTRPSSASSSSRRRPRSTRRARRPLRGLHESGTHGCPFRRPLGGRGARRTRPPREPSTTGRSRRSPGPTSDRGARPRRTGAGAGTARTSGRRDPRGVPP